MLEYYDTSKMIDPDFLEIYSRLELLSNDGTSYALQLLKNDSTANAPEHDRAITAPEACHTFDLPQVGIWNPRVL